MMQTEDVPHFHIRCRALTVIRYTEIAKLQKALVSVGVAEYRR